ncbi:flagellum-associated coiled-coil domain-containing protein 1 [Eublepharis macularius]|uniref:Flagellum-associated coiled-coil domain-containing protein 1 n=1 Tax=Eublepharis macularius TaxID=481883 RepID=A0AA97KT41_EUBMA|nr:flagellum-associated coiled-coil domain-containing protein 1 [Eublepharis macularius]
MSQANYRYCPSWDPWKIGCKRLARSKTGAAAQIPKMKFVSGMHKVPLRKREPSDISKDFSVLSPGFILPHTKGQVSVILEEELNKREGKEKELFEKTRPADTASAIPSLPSTPPKLQTEDVVADLVEQISELTGIMEQLRRDHETNHKQLENEMEEKCNELQQEHESKVGQIEAFHKLEMSSLEEQYKSELRTERATAQEKLSGMQKEYKYLKNAFRVYQDSISDEMEEKWLRRQAEWKKSERTEREKALLQQKQSLMRKFETEIEEQRKIIQNNSFLLDRAYQQEREDFIKQHETDVEKITILTQKIDALEEELKEKNETLNAIASSLHNTEMELQREKAGVADTEKNVLQRIAVVEEKHRVTMATLVEENTALRRKLIEKNEEILNERAQRSVIF